MPSVCQWQTIFQQGVDFFEDKLRSFFEIIELLV
jgi:hypothetical protein